MKKIHTYSSAFVFEELEPRLLFSADAAEALVVAPDQSVDEGEEVVLSADVDSPVIDDAEISSPVSGTEPEIQEDSPAEINGDSSTPADADEALIEPEEAEPVDPDTPSTESPLSASIDESGENTEASENSIKEVVFINANVSDSELLIADILNNSADPDSIELIILDSKSDGIAQVTDTLADYTDLDAVHFISHGRDGHINLGNSYLDSYSLEENSSVIEQWGDAFTEDGDILLYGCDIASGSMGTDLVDSLATLTGTDVAASEDQTGSASLGGDWDLEYSKGTIESGTILSLNGQAKWDNLLAVNGSSILYSTGTAGIVQELTDPALALGDTTAGTLDIFGDISALAEDGSANVLSMHYVNRDITVGGGGGSFDLVVGDVLLTVEDNTVFFTAGPETMHNSDTTTLDVRETDVFVFRPDTAGDYTSGMFYMLLDDPVGETFNSFTLVENDTTVGGVNLTAGSFLFSSSGGGFLGLGNDPEDIYYFTPSSVGAGSTVLTANPVLLVDGSDIDLGTIQGIELIEEDTVVGRITLAAGSILISSDPDTAFLQPRDTPAGLSVSEDDVYLLNITQAGSTTTGTATMVVDGSDIGQTTAVDSLSLILKPNTAPVYNDTTLGIAENVANNTEVGIAAATDVDVGDTLSYSITGGNIGNTFAIDANGQITVADNSVLDFETNPIFTLTVQAQDDGTGTLLDTATVTINLSNVNEAPVYNDASFGIAENVANNTVVGTAAATDVDAGTTLSYSITAGNTGTTFAIDANGQITVADNSVLDFETNPTFTLTVQAQDDGTGTLLDTATVTINLTNVNEVPTSSGIADVTVFEDAVNSVIDLYSAFADPEDADTDLNYSITNNSNGALFTSTAIATGSLTLDYAVNQYGTSDITVRATDLDGAFVESTFTVTVTSVDDSPIATNLSSAESFTEDAAAFSLTDIVVSDVDSANITATLTLSDAAAGVLSTANSNGVNSSFAGGIWSASGALADVNVLLAGVEFTASANYDQDFSIATSVDDGVNGAITGTKIVSVTAVNDAPVAVTESFTVVEGSTSTLDLASNDTDIDDALNLASIAIVSSPSNGSLVLNNDGTVDYSHDGSETTSDSFSYTIRDASGAFSNEVTVGLTVTLVNENAPVITSPATVDVAENTTAVHQVTHTDVDLPAVTFTYSLAGTDAALFQIDASGNLSFIVAPDYETPGDSGSDNIYNVQVNVSDEVNTTTQDLVVTVTNANDNAPVFTNPATHFIPENYSDTYQLTVSDADFPGSAPVFSIVGTGDDDALFSMTSSGQGSFVVPPDYENPSDANGDNVYILHVQAFDGVYTTTQHITINVMNLNDNTPQIDDATVALAEDSGNSTAVIDINDALTTTDLDRDSDALSYFISSGNTDNIFSIAEATGIISVADNSLLDYETTTQYVLVIQANDGTTSDTAEVTINISNVNDNPPLIGDATANVLPEDAVDNTVVFDVNDTITGNDTDRDGAVLSYAIIGGNAAGTFSINGDGEISVLNSANLDYETTPQYILEVEATSEGDSDTAFITVDLGNVNDNAPVLANTSVTVQEDAADGFVVADINDSNTGNDTDLDGDGLSYTITFGNTDTVFAIDAGSGLVRVADNTNLDFETNSQYVLTIQASDGTNSNTSTLTVNVGNVNDNAPQLGSSTVFLAEDAGNATVVIDMNELNTGLDTDRDTDTLTYSISDGNGDGIFSIDGSTGLITVSDNTNLDYETTQQYILTVVAYDGLNSGTGQVTINISNVNDNSPVVIDQAANVSELATNGTAVIDINDNGTSTDFDLDGDGIGYSITNGNGDGVFAINAASGVITVADNTTLDYDLGVQLYTLSVEASDGITSDTAQISIHVISGNDNAPQIEDMVVSLSESAANTDFVADIDDASGGDTDLDNDALTYTIIIGNGDGIFTIDGATGVVSVGDNTNLDYETTSQYVLTIQAVDGVYTDTAQLTVNIDNENDNSPLLNAATVNLPENSAKDTVVINLNEANTGNDTDLDGQSLTYSIVSGNASGTFAVNASGEITVLSNATLDFETTPQYVLGLMASDGTNSDTVSITVNLVNINDNPPLIVDATAVVDEDAVNGMAVINLNDANSGNDTDVEGDALSYAITAGNGDTLFAIDSATGAITVADNSNLDFETTSQYVLTVSATDGTFSDTAQVTININNVNDITPQIDDSNASIAENATVGDNVINLNEVNTGNDTDLDGDVLSYTVTAGNGDAIFAIDGTGQVTVSDTTNLDFETTSQYVLTIEASDGTYSDTSQVTIDIINTNDIAPLIADGITAVAEDAITGTVVVDINDANTGNDTDLDGNVLAYLITAGNGDNIFAINGNGQLIVSDTTNLDFETTTQYVLTVSASDGTYSDTAQITINITNVNDLSPQVSDVTLSLPEDTANGSTIFNIDELSGGDTDRDGNPLYYTITAGNGDNIFALHPYSGEITVANNSNLDFETTTQYVLTVFATDGVFNDTAQITINITPTNDNSPIITSPATATVVENSTAVQQVTQTDADVPDDSFTYAIAGGADAAFFQIDGSGNLSFSTAPDYDIAGDAGGDNIYDVQVSVFDGVNTTTQAIAVSVTAVNDNAPLITSAAAINSAENTTAVYQVTSTDGDLPGDSFTYAISGGADAALFQIDGSGNVSFNVAPDYETAGDTGGNNIYDLQVSVFDGVHTVTQDVSITVSNVNEAPVYNNASLSVVEQVPNNTVVGTASATDVDVGDTLTYSITAGNIGNTFAIDNNGQITVADNSVLDLATNPTFTLTIQAQDDGTGTLFDTTTVTITLTEFVAVQPPVDPDPEEITPEDGDNDTPPSEESDPETETDEDPVIIDTENPPNGEMLPEPDEEQDPSQPHKTKDDSEIPPSVTDDLVDITVFSNEQIQENTATIEKVNVLPLEEASVESVVSSQKYEKTEQSGAETVQTRSPSITLYKILLRQTGIVSGANVLPSDVSQSVYADSANVELFHSLDSLRGDISTSYDDVALRQIFSLKIVAGTTIPLTVGFASYFLRGGALLSSMFSSMPLWTAVDPVSILMPTKSGKQMKSHDVSLKKVDQAAQKVEEIFDGRKS